MWSVPQKKLQCTLQQIMIRIQYQKNKKNPSKKVTFILITEKWENPQKREYFVEKN